MKRYGRRRSWVKVDGEWKKTSPQRENSIPPMTEKEYLNWKKQYDKLKRKLKGNQRGSTDFEQLRELHIRLRSKQD